MKFLIQTIDGKFINDFSRELVEAINYNNWYYNTNEYKYETIDYGKYLKIKEETIPELKIKDLCPVGSVEFIIGYLKKNFGIDIKPINVPGSLFKYAGRFIENVDVERIKVIQKNNYDINIFVKSNEIIKGVCGYLRDETVKAYINKNISHTYQLSEEIEILSEYRCFVYQNELIGIKNYTGDFKIFPNISKIENMIKDFTDSPISYTIDVGIKDSGETIVIECHDFFSCGLYGFDNYKLLPLMFYRWFKEVLNGPIR